MSPATASAALGALRQTGSVYGIVLARGHDLLHRDAPYPEASVSGLAGNLDDIAYYFQQEGRSPDQLVFGYEEGNLVVLLLDDLRMAVFHHLAEEADFIAIAARSFLKDYATGLLLEGAATE